MQQLKGNAPRFIEVVVARCQHRDGGAPSMPPARKARVDGVPARAYLGQPGSQTPRHGAGEGGRAKERRDGRSRAAGMLLAPPSSGMSTNRNETVARARAAEVSVNREALKRAFLDKLFYMQGKFPQLATLTDYYMAFAYTVRDLMLRRWVSTAAAYTHAARAHGLLLVRRVSDRAASRQQPRSTSASTTRSGTRSRSSASISMRLLAQEPEPGLGNGGLGTAGGVLHRFARDARDSDARVRHPLRVRHLPAGDRRRLAGREDRQVAHVRQPVGDRAPRVGGAR